MNTVFKLFKLHKVTRILSRQFRSIASAAFVISIAGLVSRILGLVRDHALAYKFGASEILDVYYAAFRIPDLLFNLLVLGALSAGFIPVFTGLLKVDDENQHIDATASAWKLVNNIFHLLIIAMGFLSIILMLAAPYIMKYLVPGFNAEQMEQTVHLTQIMLLSPFFLSMSSLFGGVLQSFKRFFIYSLAPIVYNVGIIIGVLYFYDWFNIIGLAYGVVLGAALHMLIQVPFVFALGYRHQWIFDLKNRDVRKILRMMVPRTLGLAVTQFNLVIITIIASTLEQGSLAVFNFANNLQSVPIGLFGIAFAIASFPTLSQYADKEKWQEFAHTFSSTARQILFFVIPVSVLFFIFRAQIVRLVLGRGAFDWQDTILTFTALGIFSISLFAQSLIPLLARTFYSVHDTKTPFFTAAISMIINAVLSFVLAERFGLLGLVSAFTISSILQLIILWIALYAKIGILYMGKLLYAVGKILVATFFMGIAAQGAKYYIGAFGDINTFVEILMQTVAAGAVGLAVFIAISTYLKNEEILVFRAAINRRLLKRTELVQEVITEDQ